jgi:hypothetical protein
MTNKQTNKIHGAEFFLRIYQDLRQSRTSPHFMEANGSLPRSQEPIPCPDLSHINPVHAPLPTFWNYILILSSHLRLGLPNGLFPSGLPINTLYTPLLSPICATWPTHFILLDLITWIISGEEYRSLSSSSYSILYPLTTSPFLGPNSFLSMLFLHTLSLLSSLLSNHVSHPQKTTDKIIVL